MSRLARCNRCGAEQEILTPEKNQNTAANLVAALNKMNGWKAVSVVGWGLFKASQTYDLCDDCHEILVEQFLKGAAVAPITQPLAQTVLPHQPMTDCMLVWDPERGGFLCEHDDSERYHKLCRDQAQNAAEGVPPQDVQDVVDAAAQLVDDVHTAGWAHGMVQRCTRACQEQHTYTDGCLLNNVVQPPGADVNDEDEPADGYGSDYVDAVPDCHQCGPGHPIHLPNACQPGCFCQPHAVPQQRGANE